MRGLFGRDRRDGGTDDKDAAVQAALRQRAWPLAADDAAADAGRGVEPLLGLLGTARFALLGEASHGSDDFYRWRAGITRRLIVEHGCAAVAVEADWPDAWRVNRYVRGLPGADAGAGAALSGFKRFPTWMWRNTVVRDFVEWLRGFNAGRPEAERVGFYGIDLYSLFTSIRAVLAYLDRVDPPAAQRARYRYGCFERFREEPQAYGYAASFEMSTNCEEAVVNQLVELTRRRGEGTTPGDDPDARFAAEQNARLVKNAEAYYRAMFRGRVSSWNLRDEHMADTLDALDGHLAQHRGGGAAPPRIAVWAHNSHLGDASQTEMGEGGEWNVGQLMRERHGDESVRVGFTTYGGTVTAASDWDGPTERKTVRPGLAGSCEALLHAVGLPRFGVLLRGDAALAHLLEARRLQRAIGVIYRPETERQSHYFHTKLARQFDAVLHLDETRAIEPLEMGAPPARDGEAPETYPSGL